MSVQVTGIDENIAALNAIADALQSSDVGEVLEIAAEPMYYALQDYPEPRPESKYARTFALQESTYTMTEVNGALATWTAGQTDEAAHWVGHLDDDYGPAWMHKGIWDNVKAIKQKYLPMVMERLGAFLDDLIRRKWGS